MLTIQRKQIKTIASKTAYKNCVFYLNREESLFENYFENCSFRTKSRLNIVDYRKVFIKNCNFTTLCVTSSSRFKTECFENCTTDILFAFETFAEDLTPEILKY